MKVDETGDISSAAGGAGRDESGRAEKHCVHCTPLGITVDDRIFGSGKIFALLLLDVYLSLSLMRLTFSLLVLVYRFRDRGLPMIYVNILRSSEHYLQHQTVTLPYVAENIESSNLCNNRYINSTCILISSYTNPIQNSRKV